VSATPHLTPEQQAEKYAYEMWYPDRWQYEHEPPREVAQPLDHAPYRRTKRDWLAGFAAAVAQSEQDAARCKRDLKNLLARIHRDGGQYVAEHGQDKAVADADLIVADLNADRDSLAQRIKDAVAARGIYDRHDLDAAIDVAIRGRAEETPK
jgi:hypothetical protein